MRVEISEMDTPLGCICSDFLPKWKRTSENVIPFASFKDFLCFWRCLAFHLDPNPNNKKQKVSRKKLQPGLKATNEVSEDTVGETMNEKSEEKKKKIRYAHYTQKAKERFQEYILPAKELQRLQRSTHAGIRPYRTILSSPYSYCVS